MKTAPIEPELQLAEIQGIAVPGFFKPHQTLVYLRFTKDVKLDTYRSYLAKLEVSSGTVTLKDRRQARTIARGAPRPREHHAVLTALGFTYHGLLRLVNRHTINDHASKHVAGRPGVVSHGHGLFMINKPHATRYTFVRHGQANVAVPFDVIDRDTLTTTNWKAAGQTRPTDGRDKRLLVNPSTPRMLHIDGKDHLCVLTWAGTASAAWMRTDDLVHGEQIADAARSLTANPGLLRAQPQRPQSCVAN